MPKFASSLLFGTGLFDAHERINLERMRKERADKLRQTMKKYGIPACLLARGDNVRYATGNPGAVYAPMLCYCLFFVEHDPIIWEHPGRYHQIEGQAPWIKPENWRYARSWYAEIPGPEGTRDEAKPCENARAGWRVLGRITTDEAISSLKTHVFPASQ